MPHPARTDGIDIPHVFPDVPLQTEGQRQAAAAKKAKKAVRKKAAEAVKAAKKVERQKADPKGKGKARAATDDESTPEPETSQSSSESEDDHPPSPVFTVPSPLIPPPSPAVAGYGGTENNPTPSTSHSGGTLGLKPAPDFSRMAPARHAGSRYDFLKSLDGSPVYQHLVREYAGYQLRAGNTKGFKRGRPYPVIAGVPWSTWEWSQPWLPQQVHERAEGLDPLHVFLKAETAKWVRGGIDMERLEQVLLAVGLSLRDLCTAQFTNDPDERPADISAYILDSKLPFAEYEKLLGALRLFKDVRITFGNASSSTV